MRKIVITGAAGLVGQNLIVRLKDRADLKLVGILRHPSNTLIFRQLHPNTEIVEADLAQSGKWQDAFADADSIVMSQAQIGGLFETEFTANNITATRHVLDAMQTYKVPYLVHISSSV